MEKDEEENFLSKAFRIIGEGLPQFFTETNTPFLGKDEEKSVMKPSSRGQQEKEVLELLLGGGAALATGGKTALGLASKYPNSSAAALALGLQDPTVLLSGPVGVADAVSSLTGGGGSIKDAEASIVPAAAIKSKNVIDNALAMLRQGLDPKTVYKATGVYEGPLDKIPRAVVSDEGAKLMQGPPKGKAEKDWTLKDILDHPELYKAQPFLGDIKVRKFTKEEEKLGYKAAYQPAYDNNPPEIIFSTKNVKDSKELVSNLLHEAQHGTQGENKFIGGSNPSLSTDHPAFIPTFNAARVLNPGADKEDLAHMVKTQIYKATGGEAESVAVQNMKAMGDAGVQGAYTGFPLDFYKTKIEKLLMPAPDLAYMRNKAAKGKGSAVVDENPFNLPEDDVF